MKIEYDVLPEMTLEEFADANDLIVEVRERPHIRVGRPSRFYASFKHVEVMENGCLAGYFGDGRTAEEAIENYAQEISRRRIAVNAYTDHRIEIQVPTLTGARNEST